MGVGTLSRVPFEHDGGVQAAAVEEQAAVERALVSLKRGDLQVPSGRLHRESAGEETETSDEYECSGAVQWLRRLL